MPITNPATSDAHLTQGDILNISTADTFKLYQTSLNTQTNAWAPNEQRKCAAAIILSRRCVLAHKKTVIVASIYKWSDTGPTPTTFADMKLWLEKLRDGHSQPDRFYLGHINGLPEGRYFAHLDDIYTIAKAPALTSYRVATLAPDFIRDLQLRLFTSFACEGFEDFAWFSTPDLKWIVSAGEREIQSKHIVEREALNSKGASAQEFAKLERDISDLQSRIDPYRVALSQREATPQAEPKDTL